MACNRDKASAITDNAALVYCQSIPTEKTSRVIIRNYINKQVALTSLAVIGLLSFILVSGRLIRYFERAVEGRLAVDLLMAMIIYRFPAFLEVLIPLGLFVGLLLVLGRMYLDNEMAVLRAAGMGRRRLLRWLLPAIVATTALNALMVFWVAPAGHEQTQVIYAEQAQRSSFDLVQPRRFQRVGDRVFYVGSMSEEKSVLNDILILQELPRPDGVRQVMVRADTAVRVHDAELEGAVIELRDGERLTLRAGAGDYERVRFERYRLRFGQTETPEIDLELKAIPTPVLLSGMGDEPRWQSEWGRRWSLVALVPVVALLALPLAQVNPRQGRYLKLLPAIVLYLSYVVVIMAVTNGVAKAQLASWLYWVVHAMYLGLALSLLNWPLIRRSRA